MRLHWLACIFTFLLFALPVQADNVSDGTNISSQSVVSDINTVKAPAPLDVSKQPIPLQPEIKASTASIQGQTAMTPSSIVANRDDVKNSIVKIYTVANIPQYRVPWNADTANMTGSGSIIKGNRILTNAHVVADSTFIQVKRFGETRRYEAKVTNVSHAADLAILEVNDPAFFNDAVPLDFGDLPQIQQEVLVYGFPTGGGGMSVTKGVVSRIEYQRYAHSGEFLLAVQVDAAINSGNSGGPVVSGGRQIGVVMQKRTRAENIGYMVPIPVIQHFLKDIADGKQDGFPGLGIQTQEMENLSIKEKYKVPADQTGVLVYQINYNSPAKGVLQVNDVITAIDGHNITDTEEVEYRPHEYISYWYYIDQRQIGDTITFDILRDGEASKVSIKLENGYEEYRLVPYEQYDKPPTYFIYGGLVFMPMTTNYLLESNWSPEQAYQPSSEEQHEVVVMTQVLADSVNRGYHNLTDIIISKVNGQSFATLEQFYELVMNSKEPYLTLTDNIDYQIIINHQQALARTPEILKRYGIASAQSPDLETKPSVE
jgi:S1-C subfamily serine protease